MAFTNFVYTNQSSGVCSGMNNRGVNGDLSALIHTALTSGSNWTRVYNVGNKMCWAPSGGGVILSIDHDSANSGNAGLAVVRLAESQAAGVLTDPIPTVAQVGDTTCNWGISNSPTGRDFHIVAWETGIIYASRIINTTDVWEIGFAAKGIARYAADSTYNWLIGVRASNSPSGPVLMNNQTNSAPSVTANGRVFAMRNIAGSLKAERLTANGRGTSMGIVSTACAIGAGYGNSNDRERVRFHANDSNTASLGSAPVIERLCIPHLWTPVHSSLAGRGEADAFNDGASQFLLLKNSNNGVFLRITNDDPTTYPSS